LNLRHYSKAPGSTDVYFSVEAVDAEIDTTKFFSGGGSMFTSTASMYANISTFGHTALTLDYLTIVVGGCRLTPS